MVSGSSPDPLPARLSEAWRSDTCKSLLLGSLRLLGVQLCHLAAEESLRPSLAQEGVIGGLVPLLGCSETEVVVRALLGLGMLCGAE